ncbi:MAG TPA: hypothetical protein VHO25_23430 [Polyangiaceae bacterium]|nr:hypothetical protein [Polyangiaceae bacterium]
MTLNTHDVEHQMLTRLAGLAPPAVPAELSRKIRAAALPTLQVRPLHPAWLLAVAATTVCYLASALYFVAHLV